MKKSVLCIIAALTLIFTACAADQTPAPGSTPDASSSSEALLPDNDTVPPPEQPTDEAGQYRLSVDIKDHNTAVLRLTDTQLKTEYEVDRADSPDMQDEYGWYIQFGIYEIRLHSLKEYRQIPAEPRTIGLKDMQLELYENVYNELGRLVMQRSQPSDCISFEVEGNDLVFTLEIPEENYLIDLTTQGDLIGMQTMDCTRAQPFQDFLPTRVVLSGKADG